MKKKSRNCSCGVASWPLTSSGKDALPCHTHCSLTPGVGTHRQSAQAQRTGWPHRTSSLIIGISYWDLKSKNFSLSFFFFPMSFHRSIGYKSYKKILRFSYKPFILQCLVAQRYCDGRLHTIWQPELATSVFVL